MSKFFLAWFLFLSLQIAVVSADFIPKEKGTYAICQTTFGPFVIKLHETETPIAVANFIELAKGTRPFFDITKAQFVTRPFFDGLKFYDGVKGSYIASGCQENTGRMSVSVGYTFVDECYRKAEEIDGPILSEYEAAVVWSSLLYPYFSSKKGNGSSQFLNSLCEQILQKSTYSPLYKIGMSVIRKELGGSKKKIYKRQLIFPVFYGSVCMFNKGAVNRNGSRFLIVTAPAGISILNGNSTVFGKVIFGMDIINKISDSILSNKQKKSSPWKNPEIVSISIKKLE